MFFRGKRGCFLGGKLVYYGVQERFLYIFGEREYRMNLYLEIFGYMGTALVIISMMMTSVLKLRIFNMCGGLITLIYSVCYQAWPVVLMNACIISINLYKIIMHLRQHKGEKASAEEKNTP
jgi:hypothetical protein